LAVLALANAPLAYDEAEVAFVFAVTAFWSAKAASTSALFAVEYAELA